MDRRVKPGDDGVHLVNVKRSIVAVSGTADSAI
jgi:hypothetical protein